MFHKPHQVMNNQFQKHRLKQEDIKTFKFWQVFLCICSLTLVIPPFTSAAENDRTFRALFLPPAKGAPKSLYLFDGVGSTKVDLPKRNLSKVYPLRSGPLILSLHTNAISSSEAVPAGSPSVEMPEDLHSAYILVTSDPSNEVTPVDIEIINAEFSHYKLGEMLWINRTDNSISGTIGPHEIELKPGSRLIIKEPVKGFSVYPVTLYYTKKGSSRIHTLCEMKWRHNPRSRSLIFIVEDGIQGGPRTLGFSDIRASGTK
jgi:hypothetical protein